MTKKFTAINIVRNLAFNEKQFYGNCASGERLLLFLRKILILKWVVDDGLRTMFTIIKIW